LSAHAEWKGFLMPSDETIQATTEGEIKGQIVVRNFVLNIGDENGGVVILRTRSEERDYTRRKGPLNLRPRPFLALLDRDEQIATLKSAIQASKPVSLFGPAGSGKTSLLRSLAHLPETGQFPDGVVYLSVPTLGLEDLLQSLFDVFHESQVNFKPVESDIRSALQGIKALVLLDDLPLTRDETQTLLAAAPNCTFVLASLEQSLRGEAEIVP
jgi:sigma54-dependent transcription regulator